MKSLKYLIPVLIGVSVYVFISMTCGSSGMWALKQLSEQKRVISINAQNMKGLNESLKLEKTAIQNDKDVITAYARKLGYVLPGEKLVKITGLKTVSDMKYETGTVIKRQKVLYIPESVCKCCGLFVGFLVFILFLLYDISNGKISLKKKKYETISGIPVYDMPQI